MVDVRADGVAALYGVNQAVHRQVQRVGAVEREDEVLRLLAVEQPADPPAALEDLRPGLHRLAVRPAPGAGAQLGHVPVIASITSRGFGTLVAALSM